MMKRLLILVVVCFGVVTIALNPFLLQTGGNGILAKGWCRVIESDKAVPDHTHATTALLAIVFSADNPCFFELNFRMSTGGKTEWIN